MFMRSPAIVLTSIHELLVATLVVTAAPGPPGIICWVWGVLLGPKEVDQAPYNLFGSYPGGFVILLMMARREQKLREGEGQGER